jgi:hypothetical protein
MHHARRYQDMSRLALLAWCEVRRWARQAGETELAERSTALITDAPQVSRQQFMSEIDQVIEQLEESHRRMLLRAEQTATA